MKSFVSQDETTAIERSGEHGGTGPIKFSRLFHAHEFESTIDFIDATTIPPRSTIGRHEHVGSEELYYIVSGTPLVRVDEQERRLSPGDVAIVRSGQTHELINDTDSDTRIFVVQVGICPSQ